MILNETALEPGVNATRNNPPLPGIDRISQWLALGDSFSAGPGAGDPYDATDPNDCRRNKGAYGPQMEDDYFFQSPNGYDNPIFQFQSCTGDKIPQVSSLPPVAQHLHSHGGQPLRDWEAKVVRRGRSPFHSIRPA